MKRSLFLSLTMILLSCCSIVSATNPPFVVVIDPGHGGKDGGAVRDKYREKEINLKVALALGQLIEQNASGVKVVYTRKTDVFVPLDKRADIANKANANLFISIHTNATATKTTSVSGADTYILGLTKSEENLAVAKRENAVILLEDDYTTKYEGYDPNSPESNIIFEFMTNKFLDQSLEFASSVQKGFKNVAKRTDRGVRQAGFLVLRETGMPSVLIELGFINNPQEARFLSTSDGQRSMASAIYSGFVEYKRDFDKRQGGKNIIEAPSVVQKQPRVIDAIPSQQDDIKKITKVNLPTQPIATVEESASGLTEFNGISTGNKTEYRIQIFAGTELLSAKSSEFKGLSPISYYKSSKGTLFYTYGLSTSRVQMQRLLKEAKAKFKSAFIEEFAPVANSRGGTSVVNTPPTVVTQTSRGIEYRVQFLYSSTILPDNSPKFKGLAPVSYYVDNGYKYTYGSSASLSEMEKILKEVKAKFKDSFIITLEDGKRIK